MSAIQQRPVSCASGSQRLGARGCGLRLPARPLQPQQPLQQQRQRLAQRPPAGRLAVAASAAAAAAAAPYDDGGAAAGSEAPRDYRNIPRFPAFLAAVRAVAFYTTTFIFATPLFVLMLLAYPYVLLFDKWR